MIIRVTTIAVACFGLGACTAGSPARSGTERGSRIVSAEPLVLGESFKIASTLLGEDRQIDVFVPTVYGRKCAEPLPVLYMPDGGMDEDFIHIAGLVQVLVSDGVMRPCMLIGIANTNRRRDMTGPTANPEDLKIAPVVGGSQMFRRFIREELMPAVRERYMTTAESMVIGESLAGLFVIETLLREPDLFSTYIAIDPSLWWADEGLLRIADAQLAGIGDRRIRIGLASSSEPALADSAARLAGVLARHRGRFAQCEYFPMTGETHATIYHPAAMAALRAVCRPQGSEAK